MFRLFFNWITALNVSFVYTLKTTFSKLDKKYSNLNMSHKQNDSSLKHAFMHFWKYANTICSFFNAFMLQMWVWIDLCGHFRVCVCFKNKYERTLLCRLLSISMFQKFLNILSLNVLPQNPIEIYFAPFRAMKYYSKKRFVWNHNKWSKKNNFNCLGEIYYI